MMRRKPLRWLALATVGLSMAQAGFAQEPSEDAERGEGRNRTTEESRAGVKPAPPDSAGPAATGRSAPRSAGRRPDAAAPVRDTLKRIDTSPLSANANIALPQDI